jgi:hypothetical protein
MSTMIQSAKLVSGDSRDNARAALDRVEEQLATVDCPPGLREAWAELVAALALGPAPELRECSFCGKIGRRAATRCGYCWRALTAPGDTHDAPLNTK